MEQICEWCGDTVSEKGCSSCGHPTGILPRCNWDRVEEVFGPDGMPSCGQTDARIESSSGNKTVYFR